MFPIQSTYVREAEPFRIFIVGADPLSKRLKPYLVIYHYGRGYFEALIPWKQRAWDRICDNAFATPSGNVKKRRAQLKSSKNRAGVGRETRVEIRSGTSEWVVRDVWNMGKWSSECKCEARRYMAASHPAEWCGYYAKWPDRGQTIESFPPSPGSTRAHEFYTWAGRVVHVACLNTTLCVDAVGLNYKWLQLLSAGLTWWVALWNATITNNWRQEVGDVLSRM